ncbi:MAG: DUF4367 domain-containing protein [Parabacteroides sp.]|nr:DUF4367 domain-containing protein [Parabacteroides sp.]
MTNFKIILFENDSGDSIEISQFPADGAQIHLNNEVDQKGEVEISGRYTGHWIIEDEQLTLIWLQQNQIIEIITRFELNEAEKIAESLKYFY